MDELSTTEARELERCEAVIRMHLGAFIEAGTALLKIRDAKLYRASYSTFEAYCRNRWGFGRIHAHRLIGASGVAENLLPTGNIPANEAQARPLVGLAPDQQRDAWTEAVATAPDGKVTAAHVKAAVEARYVTRASPAADPPAGSPPRGPGYEVMQGDAERLDFPDESFDLVLGSPPYMDARLYLEDGADLSIARDCAGWVEWMLRVTTEALRVSRGLVLWVVAGRTEDRTYQPGPEGLIWEWWKRGGSAYRPCY
jgi:hypothetical protein